MIESEYLKNLVAKAKKLQKTIVLPEGEDERILNAFRRQSLNRRYRSSGFADYQVGP